MRGEQRQNDTRRAILARLGDTPGLRVGTLAQELGIHQKTAMHHARVLARAGELRLAREGRWLRCYLPGLASSREVVPREALVALPASCAVVARFLGVPRGTAWSVLRRLERAGLARREGARWLALQEPPALGAAWRPSNFGR